MDGGERLTYGAWERRAEAAARGLGVLAGARVVLAFESARWIDYAVAHVAVHMAGGVAVPVPAWLSEVERGRIVRDSEPAAVLGVEELAGRGERTAERRVEPPGAPGDLFYLSLPLAPASRCAAATLSEPAPPLLHAFPPGTPAAAYALSGCLAGPGSVVLPAFDAERFSALIATAPGGGVGLHPATAMTVGRHDTVKVLVLAPGHMSPAVADAFPGARVVRLSDGVPESAGDEGEVAPAGVAQHGMIWQEVFVPGVQNLPGLARRYRGPLDVGALTRALDEIVRRHGSLRSAFRIRAGRLEQVVRPHRPIELSVRDLSALDPSRRDEDVAWIVREAGARPFDLAVDPLFEPVLLRLGEDDHVLVIRTHHSVFDDWSVGVFRRQLARLYDAFSAGAPSPLPEPPVSFADFARGEAALVEGPDGERQRAFWRRELAGAPLITQLRVDDPGRPAGVPQAGGETLALTLSAELSARLRELARARRATLFMTMLAAFSVLVLRYTGQEDLVLATVVAGRSSSELEGLIGCFTKKLPVRLRLNGNPPFDEILARTRESLLGSLSNQSLPFEAILQDVLGPAAAAHGLVPQVSVMFQGVTPTHELVLEGVESAGLDTAARAGRAHFSAGDPAAPPPVPWGGGLYAGTFVIVSVDESGDQLELSARGAFHPPAVRDLLERYRTLLESVVADPGAVISELALLDEAGRAEVEALGRGPSVPPPAATLGEAWRAQVARTPDAVAVRTDEYELTFAELDALALPERPQEWSSVAGLAWVLGKWKAGDPGSEDPLRLLAATDTGDLPRGDVCLCPDVVSGAFFRRLPSLLQGATLYVSDRPPLELLRAGEVDLIDVTADELDVLLTGGLADGVEATVVVDTRQPISPEVLRALAGARGLRPYVVCRAGAGVAAAERPVRGVGRALPNYEMHVFERNVELAPAGAVGLLEARAGWRLPGRLLWDGTIELLGAGELDVRGVGVDPERIRAAVGDLGAVSLELERDGDGQAELVASITASGEPPTLAQLRRRLWRQIPGYAWPARIRDGGDGVAPTEEVVLAALWAAELGLDAVGPEANYWQRFGFALSVTRAREAGLVITTREVTRNRTIATLATALSVASAGRRESGRV